MVPPRPAVGLPWLSDLAALGGICPGWVPKRAWQHIGGPLPWSRTLGQLLLSFSHLYCFLMQLFRGPASVPGLALHIFWLPPVTGTGLWLLQAPWDKEQVFIFGQQGQVGEQNNGNGVCAYRDKQAFS